MTGRRAERKGEDHQADREQLGLAYPLGDLAADDEEAGLDQKIAGDHPLGVGHGHPKWEVMAGKAMFRATASSTDMNTPIITMARAT